ncbi:DUF4019 domain-containing protein [Xanthomonas graminis]|uniref:DUF4019 domain-containing protein n=1 Tax=Xanthomonas graminis TaxID=3390026 RepID=UPI00069D943A|nr:hypothetical protein A6R72_08260 [Xanthomonas translucens pv. graminis]UKE56296.1 DUF4019 domain-containing protein [Xanthomonas translucens pv. graminis]WIH10605.1 DUF4019 domain-containing protein [Xanthomonas translucens pv. graminis]WIH14241.1 DUF4019 domain-containing protein [Xanthomonas translucens pv. graminis]WIH17862.1 DUF4019 domain-containing protein [Xanthomonas translucens pv. graminis]
MLAAAAFAAAAQTAPTAPTQSVPAQSAPAQPAQTQPAAPKPAAKPAAARHADPAAPGPLSKQDAQMAQAGLRAAQLVDAGRSGELWDGASAVAKKAVAREAFVRQVDADRARLGALLGRGVASVARVQYTAGSQVPPGVYVNVSFPSRFANAPQPVRELVSLRLDEDKTWRLVGYHVGPPT